MLGHTALIRFVLRENFMFLILLLFDRSRITAVHFVTSFT